MLLRAQALGWWQEAHSSSFCVLGRPGRGSEAACASASRSEPPREPECACACVFVCAGMSGLFSPAFMKVAREVKGGGPGPSHCAVLAPSGSRAPGVLAFVSVVFKTPLQPCFPLMAACCPRSPRGPDNGAVGGQLAALPSCCSALLILLSCYENTTPTAAERQGMWDGEGRWGVLGHAAPRRAKHIPSLGASPRDCSDVVTSAQRSQRLPRRPHLAATRPGQLLAIWKGSDSGADCRGSRWGERSWTQEPTPWFLSSPGGGPF